MHSPRRLRQPSAQPCLQLLEDRTLLDAGPLALASPEHYFVRGLYDQLLGRQAEAAGQSGFTSLLDAGRATHEQIADAFLNSPEYRAKSTHDLYRVHLGRNADPVGLDQATQFLARSGDVMQLKISLLSSSEYYRNRAGGTFEGFLRTVYSDLFRRGVDPVGRAEWTGLSQLLPRAKIAEAILSTAEAQQAVVRGYYQRFFGRVPDTSGLTTFASALQRGARDGQVVKTLLGSDEYYVRLQPPATSLVLDGAADPESKGVVVQERVAVSGVTVTGATIRLDQNGDGVFDQTARADARGQFRFFVPVEVGINRLRAEAQDLVGRRFAATLTITRTTLDRIAPEVVIAEPVSVVVARGNLAVTGRVTDAGSGVATLQVQMDSGAFTEVPFDSAGRFRFETRLALDGGADGGHVVRLRAGDRAGNFSDPVAVAFTLDTQAPAVVIDAPATGLATGGNVVVTGRVTDAVSGVASLQAQVDSDMPFPVGVAADGTFRFETALLLDGSADGGHSVRLRAADRAGNTAEPPARAFTLDTLAPAVEVQSPAAGVLTNRNVTVAGRVSGSRSGVARLEAQVNSGAFVAVPFDAAGTFRFTTALPLDGSAEGGHVVQLRATSQAGRTSGLFALPFELDTRAPTARIGPSGTLHTTFSTIDVFFSEPMGDAAFAAASYELAVDGGAAIAIASVSRVDPTTARVNLAAPLADAAFRFTILPAVGDRAGNRVVGASVFRFIVAQPVHVTEISPANGEEMVSVTREVVVRFDDRIDPATITADSLYLIANGQRVPGRLRVSSTERFATFFPTNSLAPSTEVRVVLEGDRVRGRDGLAVDGNDDRVPGGRALADFRTLPLTRIQNTNVWGFVFDSYNPGRPVVGATVRVDAFPEANAVTDVNGHFELRNMPAPEFFVHIDGSTATNPPAGMIYPVVGKPFHSIPGQTTQLTMDGRPFNIYLPPMARGDIQALSPTATTNVGFGPAGRAELARMFPGVDPAMWDRMRVAVAPNSAVDREGRPATEGTIIPVPPSRIPAPLPPNVNPQLVVSIQASGATSFDVPAPATFPNLERLAPGSKTYIFSFNHAAGRWDVIGTATVSTNGLTLVSDPGVGIVAPGWHFVQVGTDTPGEPCVERQVCVRVRDGKLGDVIEVSLSGTNGRDFELASNSVHGRVAEIDNWERELRQNGKFYFVPHFPNDETRFTLRPYSAEITFSGIGRLATDPPEAEERRLFFLIQIDLQAGYSTSGRHAVTLTGSVGSGGGNNRLDVYRVQQRLKYLGFRGEREAVINVSGRSDTTLVQAIKLFQATIQADGAGNPANKDGRVDAGGTTNGWLSASNAPRWRELEAGYRSTAIGNETWGTNWSTDIIRQAVAARPELLRGAFGCTSLSEYPDVGPTVHGEHKAGLDIDWELDEGSLTGAGTGTAAIDFTRPFNLNQPAITPAERAVISDVVAFHNAAGGQFHEVLVGGSGAQPTYPRIRSVLTHLGISNRNVAGHHNHLHVSTRPPTQAAGPSGPSEENGAPIAGSGPLSTARGFGADPRLYYRFELANGFAVVGRSNNVGKFREILSPNVEFTAYFYQASTNRGSLYRGKTNDSGQLTDLGKVILDEFGGLDADADGLPDLGERAIGTNPNLADTDRDGLSDAAEIAQGLDPLDDRGFPTGIISSLPLQGEAKEVATVGSLTSAQGQLAYVATGSYGLAVVDASRFNNPIVLGQLDLPGDARDVAVDPVLGLAAVAADSGGVHIVDVADPMLPRLVRTINIPASQVEIIAGVVYVARVTDLRAYDLFTGESLQNLTLPGGLIAGLTREGALLYTMDAGRVLRVIDVSNGTMVARGSLTLPHGAGKIFAGNGIIYAAAINSYSRGGFATADVRNPDRLSLLSGSDIVPPNVAPGTAIVANGSGLGILVGSNGGVHSLDLMDVSNPENTAVFLTRITLPVSPLSVALASGIAFVADGARGLQVVNYIPFDNRGRVPAVTVTTSAIDVDPGTPGIQVVEGTLIPALADVRDDVQTRNVELLVNGAVVRNSVAFPFDFVAVAPSIRPGATTVTLQVRATDTGGNTTLSAPLVIGLVRDTFPPAVAALDPADGALRGPNQRTIQVRFSEPIDARAVPTAAFQLVEAGPGGVFDDGNDVAVPISNVQVRANDTLFQLTTDALAVGVYQIRLRRDAFRDRAGNVLGTGLLRSGFRVVPLVPLTVTFDAGRGTPREYNESGVNVRAGQDHLHMGDNNADGSPDLYNHSGCCSTPYDFTVGGTPFTVVSMRVVQGSGGIFTSSSGAVVTVTQLGLFTFDPAGWSNITSFRWDQFTPGMVIDDLALLVRPGGGAAASGGDAGQFAAGAVDVDVVVAHAMVGVAPAGYQVTLPEANRAVEPNEIPAASWVGLVGEQAGPGKGLAWEHSATLEDLAAGPERVKRDILDYLYAPGHASAEEFEFWTLLAMPNLEESEKNH